jgi:hypothetical protein
MPTSNNAPLSAPRQKVFNYVKETGDVSVAEIFRDLKLFRTMEIARGTMCQLRASKKLGDECIYISGWRRDEDGIKGLVLRPLYSVGPAGTPDAKKPKPLTNKERVARYYSKQKKFVNSVFSLGSPSYRRKVTARNQLREQDAQTL